MSDQSEDFKGLKRWVEECPIEAAIRIEELEGKVVACQYQYVVLDKKHKDMREENEELRSALMKIKDMEYTKDYYTSELMRQVASGALERRFRNE